MARPRKPNRPISVRLDEHLYNRLNDFCEDSGQSKTIAIERALAMYIEDYYAKQEKLEEINNRS